MSITTILALLIGLIMGVAFTIAYSAYHYYKAWKQAHDEGWDLPS
jgi:cytochrome bd-type quinol oxidase subunit 2